MLSVLDNVFYPPKNERTRLFGTLVHLAVQWQMEVAMTTITIALPDERLSQLQEIANKFGVTPEDLVRVSIEELLSRPEDAFKQAASYVLKKNAELYRRLA